MKKATIAVLLSAVLLVSLTASMALCANTEPNAPGPAPNSGDGVSDGSGFSPRENANDGSPSKGPAPSSGDGIPDGSGF